MPRRGFSDPLFGLCFFGTYSRTRLHEWYDKVTESTLREIKSVRDTIKTYEDEILNYFISRATNASAESLNSKLKAFRSQLRGVRDIPFFFYRVSLVFGYPCHGLCRVSRISTELRHFICALIRLRLACVMPK